MSILCLWIPDWQIDEESVAELTPLLLQVVPRVVLERRGVIWADGRGLPAERLAGQLLERLHEQEISGAKVGIGSAPIVAEAGARHGKQQINSVEAGKEKKYLAPLPLTLLSEDERLLDMLKGAGIRKCGQLSELTAESVEVRFGKEGSRVWRHSRGDDPRILFRPIPTERPVASIDFLDYTVQDATRLIFTLNALLDQVCEVLRDRARRARSITLTFFLPDGVVVREVLRTARATADRTLWMRRLRSALDQIRLPDVITGVSLEVDTSEPVSALQGDLFDRGFATATFVEEAVSRLLDLYRGLFVKQQTNRHPLAEGRTRWIDLTPEVIASGEPTTEVDGTPALELQLLSQARPLKVRTLHRRDHVIPMGYLDGKEWRTLTSAGPDRISGGHEEARPYAREYYRCVSDAGSLLWVYRDAVDDRWYLQGWWD